MFGEVQPIRQRMYGSGNNIYPEDLQRRIKELNGGFIPTTPPESKRRPRSDKNSISLDI